MDCVYSPWGCKELDMTDLIFTFFHFIYTNKQKKNKNKVSRWLDKPNQIKNHIKF